MKPTGPTNPYLKALIQELKKQGSEKKANIWKKIAYELEKPTRNKREVNLWKISKLTKANDTVIIPGKVLGVGELNHNVNIAAWKFSESAKSKIKNPLKIQELMKKNPAGKNIKIIC